MLKMYRPVIKSNVSHLPPSHYYLPANCVKIRWLESKRCRATRPLKLSFARKCKICNIFSTISGVKGLKNSIKGRKRSHASVLQSRDLITLEPKN